MAWIDSSYITEDHEDITQVLLADGWHQLRPGSFGWDDVDETFSFIEGQDDDSAAMVGPYSSILAIRYDHCFAAVTPARRIESATAS